MQDRATPLEKSSEKIQYTEQTSNNPERFNPPVGFGGCCVLWESSDTQGIPEIDSGKQREACDGKLSLACARKKQQKNQDNDDSNRNEVSNCG